MTQPHHPLHPTSPHSKHYHFLEFCWLTGATFWPYRGIHSLVTRRPGRYRLVVAYMNEPLNALSNLLPLSSFVAGRIIDHCLSSSVVSRNEKNKKKKNSTFTFQWRYALFARKLNRIRRKYSTRVNRERIRHVRLESTHSTYHLHARLVPSRSRWNFRVESVGKWLPRQQGVAVSSLSDPQETNSASCLPRNALRTRLLRYPRIK